MKGCLQILFEYSPYYIPVLFAILLQSLLLCKRQSRSKDVVTPITATTQQSFKEVPKEKGRKYRHPKENRGTGRQRRVSLVVRVLIKVCVRNRTNGRCGQIDGRNRLEVKLQILQKLYCTQI
nr:unnamed protein product [Haemonchus contortus]